MNVNRIGVTSKEPEDGKLPFYVKARIDRLRMEVGGGRQLTYEELADRIGMDKAALSRTVNGKGRVRLDTLQRIANGLGVRLGDLFGVSLEGKRDPVQSEEQLLIRFRECQDHLLQAVGEYVEATAKEQRKAILKKLEEEVA